MKIIAGMATTNERLQYAEIAFKSIVSQCNDVQVYNNSTDIDRADNGKYWGLFLYHKEPIYYLTLDDDIIYPPDYVDNMLQGIEKHGCIVSHHGRILKGLSKDYYYDHHAFAFYQENLIERRLDVFGDGVAAFRTDYFNPLEMPFEKQKLMADTLVSKKMWEEGKEAVLLKHKRMWLKPQNVPKQLTISGTRHKRAEEKNKLADEIWYLKNK